MIMPDFDYALFGLGLLTGAVATALFFAGLAWGMRVALRRARPAVVLLPSAALRIALLIGAGLWISKLGIAALAGFVLAFLLVRVVVMSAMRPPRETADLHLSKEVT